MSWDVCLLDYFFGYLLICLIDFVFEYLLLW
jgi:hypothetical protein